MLFMSTHPGISLHLHPMIDPRDVGNANIDLAIRWGRGDWSDMEIERIFRCPAFPTAGTTIAATLRKRGLSSALPDVSLLHDHDGSTAWQEWHRKAGLPYRPTQSDLVISDPNVRVQAVIDGQGLALNDQLVTPERDAGKLERVSNVALDNYGYYLAYPAAALDHPATTAFRDWIIAEASRHETALSADSW